MSAVSTVHGSDLDRGLGSTLQLGSDYEKKKQKLLQELQLDYRTYIAKQNTLKTREPHVQQQGLSLPINERASIKERLREERRKEYNLFLQEQALNRRLKRETPPISSKPEPFQASPSQGSPLPLLNTQTNTPPPHKERPAPRTSAATLTETVGHGRRHKDAWNHGTWRRRRWQIHKSEELHEEELSSDEEENLDFRHRRKQDRSTQVPEYKEKKRTRKRRGNRAFQDLKEAEAPAPRDQKYNEGILKSAGKETPDDMRTAVRSTSVTRKDEAEFATGLMIGTAEEQTVTQMKKEQYKQELLKQIAEQQRNKIKEKRLELKVAATGATDPEKQPERIKQSRVAHQQYEDVRRAASHRSGINLEAVRKDTDPRHEDDNPLEDTHYKLPRGNSQVDFSTQQPGKTVLGPGMGNTQDVPLFDFLNEDYHRDFIRMPGGVAFPRDAPPIIPDTHQAPYGAAHHYNKTRSPLDNLLGGMQQSQMPPPVRANEAPPFATEGLRVDKQRRESVLSYQEALKQQIKEKEEKKRREKEEKERSDAKLVAAMLAYDPWGRSGGGAPIKDQNGNLVSDLKQMHRINNDRESAAKEAEAPLSHQRSDSSHRPPSHQLSNEDRYKEELKQQIEENKRRQAEEQDRIRVAEEEEEERLVKERARILQAYEEEQRKQKKAESNPKKLIHEAKAHHRVEAKRKNNHSAQEREKTSQPTYQSHQREPSPPIPTLQKKHVAPKPPPDVNQLSSRTERSVSAPHAQPVPTTVPTPKDDQQEVVKRLSALRNYLRKEQKQMELQMDQTETSRSHLDRRQPRMDAFEFVIKDGVQSSAGCGGAEKQNQRRSNQFKHRGGEIYQQGATRPLEERWERTASRRKQVYEEDADSIDRRERNNQLDYHSLKLWRARATDQNTRQLCELDYNRTEGPSGDRVPSSRSTQRRPISMETTEPWLHPGTSETAKHTTHRRKPNSRLDALPWLTQRITILP